jgi:DNA processing protein
MSATEPAAARAACASCLRRSWLLAELAGPLDCNCRADGRLFDLLELPDERLIGALGGRRRGEVLARHGRFATTELRRDRSIAEICAHDPGYPRGLRSVSAPPMLFVRGSLRRLTRLTAGPVVAVVGTTRATDYGMHMANALARGLAASGVTVAGELTDGIARAGHEGALQAGAASLAVLCGGADVTAPARRRSLLERIANNGAAVSELPCGTAARRWGAAASVRIVAALADVTIVVEANDSPRELRGAVIAGALGRTVAAVPGRVTSHASRGSNALLREGAALVRDPGDVLDLLDLASRRTEAGQTARDRLAPHLREVLERVGAGIDTAAKLAGGAADAGALLQALSELELLGLLARGDGGRYVAQIALGDGGVRYGSSRQMEP